MEILATGQHETTPTWTAETAGSKGANLLHLGRIGFRVPPAFVLGTGACRTAVDGRGRLTDEARDALRDGIARLERATGRVFGGSLPLLVSVRSSPPASMPGMLSTVLNIGMNAAVTRRLLHTTGNPAFVWDTSRRFVESFAEIVGGCTADAFSLLQQQVLAAAGCLSINELDPLSLRDLSHESERLAEALSTSPVPDNPFAQLEAAVVAVIQSWNNPQAAAYRRLNDMDDTTGTAVIIQAMVFGNWNSASGSGVGFTRNPSTGDDELYYDFLFNAQGQDIVSGRQRIADAAPARRLPNVDAQLRAAARALETEFRDMQDFEFTVENGELYFLQTRAGKRTAWAAAQIAADLVRDQVITRAEARERLRTYDLTSVRRTKLSPDVGVTPVATGVTASVGAATGHIVLDAARAESSVDRRMILVREDLVATDIAGLAHCAGVLTARGGRTSHAAVVARQLEKVCVVGCASLHVDEGARRCSIGGKCFTEGEVITLDGETGAIYAGTVPMVEERPDLAWARLQSSDR